MIETCATRHLQQVQVTYGLTQLTSTCSPVQHDMHSYATWECCAYLVRQAE